METGLGAADCEPLATPLGEPPGLAGGLVPIPTTPDLAAAAARATFVAEAAIAAGPEVAEAAPLVAPKAMVLMGRTAVFAPGAACFDASKSGITSRRLPCSRTSRSLVISVIVYPM